MKTKITNILEIKEVQWMLMVVQAIVATMSVFLTMNFNLRTGFPSVIFILCLLTFCLENKLKIQAKAPKTTWILAVIYALFSTMGNYNTWEVYAIAGKVNVLVNGLLVFCGALFIYRAVATIIITFLELKENKATGELKQCKRIGLVSWGIIFGVWLVYFLAFAPGILTVDSIDHYRQVVGVMEYSNHHPFVYTLFLKVIYDVFYAISHSVNVAVGAGAMVQMLIVSAVYAYMISVLNKIKIKKAYIYLCIAYAALLPVNAMYSFTIWKDVLFGAFALLFTIAIWKLAKTDWSQMTAKQKVVLLAEFLAVGILFSLWRSNGFYAYIICIPFLLLAKSFSKKRIPISVVMVLTIAIVIIVKGPVMNAAGVQQPDFVENISVPLQHVGRVITERGCDNLPSEDIEKLNYIMDVNAVSSVYTPHIADPMKVLLRAGDWEYLEENKSEYLSLWFRWAIKYPKDYLKAQIDVTKGFWFPNTDYWVNAYVIVGNELGIQQNPILPQKVWTRLVEFDNLCTYIPFVELFWEIGFYIWVEIFCVVYAVYKKKVKVHMIPIMAIWATLMIATPVAYEFRYGFAFVTCLPFIVGTCLLKRNG